MYGTALCDPVPLPCCCQCWCRCVCAPLALSACSLALHMPHAACMHHMPTTPPACHQHTLWTQHGTAQQDGRSEARHGTAQHSRASGGKVHLLQALIHAVVGRLEVEGVGVPRVQRVLGVDNALGVAPLGLAVGALEVRLHHPASGPLHVARRPEHPPATHALHLVTAAVLVGQCMDCWMPRGARCCARLGAAGCAFSNTSHLDQELHYTTQHLGVHRPVAPTQPV
jgi:hypothetical protein